MKEHNQKIGTKVNQETRRQHIFNLSIAARLKNCSEIQEIPQSMRKVTTKVYLLVKIDYSFGYYCLATKIYS